MARFQSAPEKVEAEGVQMKDEKAGPVEVPPDAEKAAWIQIDVLLKRISENMYHPNYISSYFLK